MSIFKKYVNYLKQKKSRPKPSVRNFNIYHTHSSSGGSDESGKKASWIDSIVDAFIISGLAFFSTLGGDSVTGLNTTSTIKASTIAAGIQFFIFLALKRGIGQTKKHPH